MQKRSIALVEALADGVTAYMTLQARCGLWPAYTEYLLYDPIVRIGSHLGWTVNCEYKLPKDRAKSGDNPRLDFMFVSEREQLAIAMEVKWPRDPKKMLKVNHDISKLRRVKSPTGADIDARLLLIAGPHEITRDRKMLLRCPLKAPNTTLVRVRALGAGKRAWGTSIYELLDN